MAVGLIALAVGCAAPQRPPERAQVPTHPVILVHGFSGWHELGAVGAYFHGVRDALTADGVTVFDPALPPYAPTERRAAVLARVIDNVLHRTGATKVHLVAHSQGGLDARYVVDVLGYGDRVATIVTFASPHRGTPLADLALHIPAGLMSPVFTLVGNQLTAGAGQAALGEPDIVGALQSLSTRGARALDAKMPGDPRVPLYSIAGLSGPDEHRLCSGGAWPAPDYDDFAGAVWVGWGLIHLAAETGTNDGIVPTASMPKGTFLGCVAADHIDEIGLTGNGRFDHIAFFRRVVTGLAVLERSGSDVALRSVGRDHSRAAE